MIVWGQRREEMKAFFKRVFLLFIFSGLLSIAVFADMGPKPSVTLNIYGLDADEYYVTMFSKNSSTGPYSWAGDGEASVSVSIADTEAVWKKFAEYQDSDQYYFLQYYDVIAREGNKDNTSDKFIWSYYPPEAFKVVIYIPETDQFFSSEPTETYAFKSSFEVVLSDGQLEISRTYGWGWEVFGFLFRLAGTIGIEVLVAVIFGYRRNREFLVILAMNVITQVILNVVLLGQYQSIFIFYVLEYFWLEFFVFAVEAAAYIYLFRKSENRHPIGYALTANAASFLLGYLISGWFPYIF